MLKTNSKKARENTRHYIMDNFTPENYDIEKPDTFEETAKIILDTCNAEKSGDWYCHNMTRFERFKDWCQGLPSIFQTLDIFTPEAVDILGDILEETPDERNAYEDKLDEVQDRLIYLIFRELERGV